MKTLEEVIKNKTLLTSSINYINIYSHPGSPYTVDFDTYIFFEDILFNDSKEMYKILKPFIYYVYSLTFNTNFFYEVAFY